MIEHPVGPQMDGRGRQKGDESTFVLADLAGYTALTEVHGDDQAADIAGEFFAAVRRLLEPYGAEEVKTIGDAILLRVPNAANAVRVAARLVNDVGRRDRRLGVRVGVHTGTAVRRGDDWYGAAVNVTSRVADVASAGEVVVTAEVREAAGDALAPGHLAPRGPSELKNVRRPVELFVLVPEGRCGSRQFPIDPVCRMAVDPEHCAGPRIYRGVEYHFCSSYCADAFASDPDRYASRSATDAPAPPSPETRTNP
jgi:class 3 adenylate cyclase/YHS domain-containing protein